LPATRVLAATGSVLSTDFAPIEAITGTVIVGKAIVVVAAAVDP
jgi:hypothetical protein